jgi:4-amino-4-deoxy-L-arabinose transferase-like glycosyltransferase
MTNNETMTASEAGKTSISSLMLRPSFVARISSCISSPLSLLCAYSIFLFFVGLGERDLLSSHEARAAQDAQMIVSDGCWGLPRLFDGHLEMQKPPLYYWLVALFGHLFNGHVDAWAVRLPAALSALGCVIFLYYLGRKNGRPLAGFVAALVLASCLHFTWLARVGRIDMPLTLAVTVAVGCFYRALSRLCGNGPHSESPRNCARGPRRADHQRRGWLWCLVGYVSVAAGILLKGPIALALVGVIVGAYLAAGRAGRGESQSRLDATSILRSLWWGVPLVMLLAAPWFIWANYETNNQVWEVFFYYHNIERGLGGSETLASHPVWFYLPRVLIDLLPWSLGLVPAGWYLLKYVGWRFDPLARFGAVWFVAVFALLSLMSFKRADYLLPAYPGAALFLGCVGEYWLGRRRPFTAPRPRLAGFLFAALLATYALGWGVYNLWIVPSQEQGWPYRQLARAIRAATDKPVIFFRAESHVLAFHVGRPLDTILEWENLDIWASQPTPIYFVMPPDCARDWPSHLAKGRLEEVFRTSDQPWGKRERPLVVMRSYGDCIKR